MKNLTYCILVALLSIFGCKKDSPEPVPEKKEIVYKDSVSFMINGKTYSCNNRFSMGAGNKQFNLKPSTTAIPGRRVARENGLYWYGPIDSTLYSAHYGLNSWGGSSSGKKSADIEFIFTKQYKNDQLRKDIHLFVPANNSDLLKVGKQGFAVDWAQEAAFEGVAMEVHISGVQGLLSTYIPEFSDWRPTNLTKSIQNNSVFEINKVEKLDNGMYVVEAMFEMNLYDQEDKLYRLENGFLRLVTNMKVYGVFEQ